ncbi:MAG: hypothetical protein LC751_01710 [Actinobacteria bacterium]|nr:hypothetical protein [Actinomycetota bacterium]MCA1737518.1 hypothetical protein [Actinomycetota bacterium]
MRKAALKVLPLLVVLWTTLVIVGGAVRMANESEATTQDATVKTGLGLCAVSVALLMSTGARRKILLPVLHRKLLPKSLAPLRTAVYPKARLKPPSSDPPTLQLLQVSRT